MAIYGYTKNYKLIKPQFNTDTWHDYIYDNLDTIDAVMSAIYASGNWKGFWATNTVYTVGDVIIDQDTDTMYKVMVDHTTSEADFATEYANNPTYYELWSPNNLAESWATDTTGLVSNTDYSSKAYAISSGLIDDGSAKEWAVGTGTIGNTNLYSAKKYADDTHNDYISMTTDVNVVAVGSNIASVNAVAGISSAVSTVANKITEVDTVAWISNDVTTVAGIATAVTNVSNIESSVLDVSDNRTDISTVASNISDVNTVAGISTDIPTVAANDANVTTVATNISDVNTAAANMTAIQNAPTAASNAAASATLAQDWATKTDGQVASTDYSSKYYAGQAATSAQSAQDAVDEVNGLIATPIGTIFQSIYVDEDLDKARMLNGQLISSTKFTGFRTWLDTVQTKTPNLFTDEATWQAEKLLSKFGQVGKFVIDDVAHTIRLPAVVNAQGLLSLSGIGNLVNESLPNITGETPINAGWDASVTTGAFVAGKRNVFGYTFNGSNNDTNTLFDASRSSSTYQTDAPVQQEAIQYPYYIQVATGIEEELPAIREYKTNVPYVLGDSRYFEVNPYNASWLVSNGQYNAQSLYPDMYTQLNNVELNSSLNVGDTIEIDGKTYVKRGLPVVLSTGTITDYDFVVNQNDQTFRLPLKSRKVGGGKASVIGNGKSTGWTDGTNTYGTGTNYNPGGVSLFGPSPNALNAAVGMTGTNAATRANIAFGISTDPASSGIIADLSDASNDGLKLYYYVGDTVQDASLINAGAVLGQLSNKADIDASNFNAAGKSFLSGLGMPSGRYIDLTLLASGQSYTAPANGWFFGVCAGDVRFQNFSNGIALTTGGTSLGGGCAYFPVKKGDAAVFQYSTSTYAGIRFIYAEGEE